MYSNNATVIDGYNIAHLGQKITFVGEWECCSLVLNTRNGNKAPFNKTHEPIYTPHDAYIPCLNTDPYVFGEEFYYVYCKLTKTMFNKIQVGDIVIFGSYTLNNQKVGNMKIDTVLVVGEKITLANIRCSRYSQCYKDVTLSKLNPNNVNGIIIGKMYNPSLDYASNEPFSFVPCRRDDNGVMTPLIINRRLKIRELKGKPFPIGQKGGHVVVSNIRSAFDAIVNAIRNANYELGVFLPEPVLNNNSTIATAAAKYTPLTKSARNTNCNGSCTGGNTGICSDSARLDGVCCNGACSESINIEC